MLDMVSISKSQIKAPDLDSLSRSKEKILAAALKFIVKQGAASASMAEIAKAAGISRQALYLQFPDRAALLLALARYTDAQRGLPAALERVHKAGSGLDALEQYVSLQARMNPGVWAIARGVEAVRRQDEAAEAAWQDRLRHRLLTCRGIVRKLQKEGLLRAALTVERATDLLWTVTSLRTWEDLVQERKWSARDYESHILELLRRMLLT